jgi:acetyl/propionyl-CoA carboxylase alpha subunit
MFTRLLVANRGEIAVRIIRACRDMGIATIALYDEPDIGSLHVRLADECVRLAAPAGYLDSAAIITIARERCADALHPGYGFLAEEPEFAAACTAAGITFVGPDAAALAAVRNKPATLRRVAAAGFAVPQHSGRGFADADADAIQAAARALGFPLLIKSERGGRARGATLVREPHEFDAALAHTRAAAQALFGDRRVYLEAAILPARYLEVQLLVGNDGDAVVLGERDSSIQRHNRKLLTEAPAPGLSDEARAAIWKAAAAIGRLLGCRGLCSAEFVLDADGRFFFTELKARIQVEHMLTEMVSGLDLVREQLRVAAGELPPLSQPDVRLCGHAFQCRINAEDPWHDSLPSPGRLQRFRLPGGPHVRVDTYAYGGCDVLVHYDSLLAKVATWDTTREGALRRMRRALADFAISGVVTDLPVVQRILDDPAVADGSYTTEFAGRALPAVAEPARDLPALAAAAAAAYLLRCRPPANGSMIAASGWLHDARRIG